MSGLYYFFPRIGGLGMFQAAGLSDRFASPPQFCEIGADVGPEGLCGMVFHRTGMATLPRPIEWHATDGEYWIGWHPARRPRPQDFERGGDCRAKPVKLRDGREWQVPLVLECTDIDPTRRCGLPLEPRVIDGVTTWAPLAEHDELRFDAFRLVERLMENGTFTIENALPYVARVLGVRYRIGEPELVALRLIDEETAREVMLASVDWEHRVLAAAGAGGEVLAMIGA